MTWVRSAQPIASEPDRAIRLAGLLLTGGASRRMGFAKGTLERSGNRVSHTLGEALGSVTDPTLEVGPSYSGLDAVAEDVPGQGPTSAIVAGWDACRPIGGISSVLVLACDLPFVTRPLLVWLASRPGHGSVVPVVDGRAQPLCARWSAEDVGRMRDLVEHGHHSFHPLLASGSVAFLDERAWGRVAEARAFADADSPEDLERLGLSRGPGTTDGRWPEVRGPSPGGQ